MTADGTIAAIATPGGTGAVAVLRISGPAALAVAERAGGWTPGSLDERRATLRSLRDRDGRVLDRVLVTWFAGPRSYTGEDVVEISTHGGRLVVRRVLERLLECGARSAGPGEFTERAFFNGKLDLTQAEAVMDLIHAQSDFALRAAHEQLDGRIGEASEGLRGDLIEVLAQLEAWIDFPEEDIDPETGGALRGRIAGIIGSIEALIRTADQGRILREGLRTVICGRPNAGKSSLLNRLLGSDRAIVCEREGTTRDTIEEMLVVEGVPLRVVDTAGLHATRDEVEGEGIRRTLKAASEADLLLVVVDATLDPAVAMPAELPQGGRRLLVLNKSDLGEHPGWSGREGLRVSSRDGAGFEQLRAAILELAEFGAGDWGEHSVAINARHRECLSAALVALKESDRLLGSGTDAEVVALTLREALDHLGEIAGRVDTEEILGSIFQRFCIGK